MKTIVHVVTSDAERKTLAKALGKTGMVSRSDINEAVQAYVKLLLTGADCTAVYEEKQPPQNPPARPTSGFKPSRGDEPYIFKAEDETLHQLHRNLLDALEAFENYVWADMEGNRRG